MTSTQSRTALVTGGSRGIGRAIALQLARSGFRIALHYHSDRSAAEETLRALEGDGHSMHQASLSEQSGAAALADAALAALDGRVDVLVHNAGIYFETALAGPSGFADWQQGLRTTMQVNFFAGADLAYLLVPAMAAAGWGRIIQVASRSGRQGEARFSAYGASKAAQINFVNSLAVELAPHGISCFAVAPGWVQTQMSAEAIAREGERIRAEIPMGRVATPEEIAELVGYLVTPAADYLTGNTIDVNGASYRH